MRRLVFVSGAHATAGHMEASQQMREATVMDVQEWKAPR
jgi:hypothetical protein